MSEDKTHRPGTPRVQVDAAAAENRGLLEEFPDDLEAANRLGKALTELADMEWIERTPRTAWI